MRIAARVLGLAAGVSEFHLLIKYIATAHEHTSHDTRRGHGTREARTDGERADRKMTVGQGLTEDETRRRRTRKAKGRSREERTGDSRDAHIQRR